jgi:hypothetical protein
VIDAQQTFTEIFSIRGDVSVAKQFAAGRPYLGVSYAKDFVDRADGGRCV